MRKLFNHGLARMRGANACAPWKWRALAKSIRDYPWFIIGETRRWICVCVLICLSPCTDGQTNDTAVPGRCNYGSEKTIVDNSRIALELENRCLGHYVDVLAILVALAGMIGIFAPSFLYAKVKLALCQASKARKDAVLAVRRSRLLLAKQYVHRGKQHYVHAKNCRAQLGALEGLEGERPSADDALSALKEMRINFFVQMIVAIERAIAYSFRASYREGLVAGLYELGRCVALLGSFKRDSEIEDIRRRLQNFIWVVTPDELFNYLRSTGVNKMQVRSLVDAYEDAVSKFGKLDTCQQEGEKSYESDGRL